MYLTNSPIIIPSDDFDYRVKKITLDAVFYVLDEEGFVSAIGHQATVDFLKKILPGLANSIVLNRIEIKEPSEQIVFKLLERLPEGKVLTSDEISSVKYEFWSIVPVQKSCKETLSQHGEMITPYQGWEEDKERYRA